MSILWVVLSLNIINCFGVYELNPLELVKASLKFPRSTHSITIKKPKQSWTKKKLLLRSSLLAMVNYTIIRDMHVAYDLFSIFTPSSHIIAGDNPSTKRNNLMWANFNNLPEFWNLNKQGKLVKAQNNYSFFNDIQQQDSYSKTFQTFCHSRK